MKANPGANISLSGGGSGEGIKALIDQSTDIANSSREIKKTEVELAKSKNVEPVETVVAIDAIVPIVSPKNKVKDLTVDQLSQIYQGKITNWKEVGGADAEIRMYGRENSSGTYTYFHDEVVKADYDASVQSLPGTAAVVNAVKKDVNGIGYGGAAYAIGVKHAKVKKDANSTAFLPTAESIGKGEYPITRYLYMYLRNRPTGETKKYIDWILSQNGQMVVTEVGYFPYK